MVADIDKNVQRQAGWPQYIKCLVEAGGVLSTQKNKNPAKEQGGCTPPKQFIVPKEVNVRI